MPRKKAEVPKPTGRPRKEINQTDFEYLCEFHCSQNEILKFFGASESTMDRWCKVTYNQTFRAAYKDNILLGNCNLRKTQWNTAMKGNVTMLIWLGKQYLGQKDVPDTEEAASTEQLDALSQSLMDMAAQLDKGGGDK